MHAIVACSGESVHMVHMLAHDPYYVPHHARACQFGHRVTSSLVWGTRMHTTQHHVTFSQWSFVRMRYIPLLIECCRVLAAAASFRPLQNRFLQECDILTSLGSFAALCSQHTVAGGLQTAWAVRSIHKAPQRHSQRRSARRNCLDNGQPLQSCISGCARGPWLTVAGLFALQGPQTGKRATPVRASRPRRPGAAAVWQFRWRRIEVACECPR